MFCTSKEQNKQSVNEALVTKGHQTAGELGITIELGLEERVVISKAAKEDEGHLERTADANAQRWGSPV